MPWKKMGLIFQPNDEFEWMTSHAQVPTVYVMNDRLRVFFSTRNKNGKSQIACMDLDKRNPAKIIKLYDKPLLGFGKPGTFDDDGVMPSSLIKQDNKLLVFYTGWNQRLTIPYHNAIGVAVSHDNGLTLERLYDGPILDKTLLEPYLAVTPSVLKEQDAWMMWYSSGIKWEKIDQKYEPTYIIKYATSADGIHWDRPNHTTIDQKHSNEVFSSPNVLKFNDIFHMWYCHRNTTDYRHGDGGYRIGYAESSDGLVWQRKDDEVGITLSETGWDNKMLCYPHVVNVDGVLHMFYNGNDFGKSGFGYAVWEH